MVLPLSVNMMCLCFAYVYKDTILQLCFQCKYCVYKDNTKKIGAKGAKGAKDAKGSHDIMT